MTWFSAAVSSAFSRAASILLPALAVLIAMPADAGAQSPDTSMLRVNITSQGYNFALPWQKLNPGTRRGLGALLAGNRVLVTAEMAQDATYLELERAASGRRITGRVEAIDYELNLATIVPADDPGDFFAGMLPLEPDVALKPAGPVEVWQFEQNGSPVVSTIELTRVDLGTYFLEEQYFLIFQASGAVQYRSGTFTLPVVKEGKLAGMLVRFNSRDQVADILPAATIGQFLEDAATPPYEGKPNFGVRISPTLDPQLRSWLKLKDDEGGVLITGVTPGFSAAQSGVREGDVILSIDGMALDSRGYYNDPDYGLLGSGHLVRGRARVGDVLRLKVRRDGELLDLDCRMLRQEPEDYLVPPYLYDRGPKYLLLGGLLFQELTVPYLKLAGNEWRERAPFRLLYAHANPEESMKEGKRKLVFLSGVLPSPCTIGYEQLSGLPVERVNDRVINDIRDLDAALRSPIDGIHRIEFQDYPKVIHVDADQARRDNEEFLPQRYRIETLQRLE